MSSATALLLLFAAAAVVLIAQQAAGNPPDGSITPDPAPPPFPIPDPFPPPDNVPPPIDPSPSPPIGCAVTGDCQIPPEAPAPEVVTGPFPPPWIPDADWQVVVAGAGGLYWIAYLIAAIGWQETKWGTQGWGRPSQGSYILGVGVPDAVTQQRQYAGLQAQVDWQAPQLQAWFPAPGFAQSQVIAYGMQVQRPGDPVGWGSGVYATYRSLVLNAQLRP